mmetsp:Transcript_31830/g.85026  ORF Transcript_31830/g.85026 Transcript_31830/m.85026 type:complete len:99 (+) Transcript_31830:165-461(+)
MQLVLRAVVIALLLQPDTGITHSVRQHTTSVAPNLGAQPQLSQNISSEPSGSVGIGRNEIPDVTESFQSESLFVLSSRGRMSSAPARERTAPKPDKTT